MSLGNAPLVKVRGDIDHSTCGSLQSILDALIAGGNRLVLIDLQDVSYIDSGGLSVLLGGVRTLRDRGWLGVIAPNQNVERLLKIVGLLVDPCFKVFHDRDAAAAALAEREST